LGNVNEILSESAAMLVWGLKEMWEETVKILYLYLTTHNIHKRRTSMPPEGFETKIPANERPQTNALDREATGLDCCISVK
jgi:hypothetical protein